MKESRKWKAVAFSAALILTLLAFFACDVLLLDMHDEPWNYHLNESTEERPLQADSSIWFHYGTKGNELFFGTSPEAREQNVRFFQLNEGTVQELSGLFKDDTQEKLQGNIIAVTEPYSFDIDGDGTEENVVDACRTDFGTYAFNPVPQIFDSNDIPFELVFSERNKMMVRFNGAPLKSKEIRIKTSNGLSQFNTDENGYIIGLPIRAIQDGFTAFYENEGTLYRMYYAVEYYGFFTIHTLIAHIPLILVLVISAIGILFVQIFRSKIFGKSMAYTGFGHGDKKPQKSGTGFLVVRWSMLLIGMFYFTWFARVIRQGQLLNYVVVPVYSCPFNLDQVTEVPCYYLSHIPALFNRFGSGLPVRNILYAAVFIITLLIFIIFLGRILCGFLCPAGLIQDIMYKIRDFLHIRPITVTDKMSAGFTILKWLWIVLFVGFAFTGGDFCKICPVKVFTTAQGGFITNLVLNGFLAAFILIGSFFIDRFWCLMCPLGYLMGLFHKFNLFKLKKDCTACTECGACYEACPMRLKHIYTERKTENIQSIDCLMCGECIRNCPENTALKMTFCKKPIYTSSRKGFLVKYKKGRGQHGK